MSIYTKTGDKGESGLIGGTRKFKSDPVFEVLGNLDELNAIMGFLHKTRISVVRDNILEVQSDLFSIGAYFGDPKLESDRVEFLEDRISDLEDTIDKLQEEMPELRNFILPGGTDTASRLHLARAVCRRVERSIVRFNELKSSDLESSKSILKYINRLSDFLFVLARYSNHKNGVKENIWKG